MDIRFDPMFFIYLTLAAYVLNVAFAAFRKHDLSADRLLLRAPIVAVLAALIYGVVTIFFGMFGGLFALVMLAWYDITPGVMRGVHA